MIIDRFVKWRMAKSPGRYQYLRADLVSARSGMTAEMFLVYAIAVSLLVGVFFGVIGYFISTAIVFPQITFNIYNIFNIQPPSVGVPALTVFAVRLIGGVLLFVISVTLTYILALKYPSMQKSSRSTKINLTLHNAVSYMYAMRRGGAELLDIFVSLSENADIYGEVALEFRQVVRDCHYFGEDVITALRNLAMTTPSEKMKDFLEDMLSVIESGGNLSEFLSSRVRIYQDDARFEQGEFLNILQLVAESYVTVFVAGPLFLIIIMVVLGMIGQAATVQLTALTYGLIPIASLIFILFIDLISVHNVEVKRVLRVKELREYEDVRIIEDPGDKLLFDRLRRYDRTRVFKEFLHHPLEWFITDVNRTFLVTAPLALIYVGYAVFSMPPYRDPELIYSILDDHIILAVLLVMIPYAVVYEVWHRKVNGIEASIPEFLDRLAGINRVGLTIAGAIGVLVKANLGVISYEIKRIKRDLDWGASVGDALVRFEQRVQTAAIARTVTLITKASEMSGDIGEVLAIASSDARMGETLKRERLSEMFIYTAIIYLAFFVFIFVVFVLNTMFLDLLEGMASVDTGTGAGFMQAGDIPIDVFRRLLYHICLVQAFFSGLIAGQMGESSLRSGVKHGVIMLIAALVIFNLFI